jgi:L-2,4-diaminobutyric acid acetyltransferase
MTFRGPAAKDAAVIWRLAPQRGSAQQDSCYAYLLLCTHFADTGIVAEQDGVIAGYALAYRPPLRPEDTFVWQLGVASGHDSEELSIRMLEELLARRACASTRFLCMTCSPRDAALQVRFAHLARRLGVRCATVPCFPGSLFAEPHLDESLLRVGPLPA